MNTKIKSYRTPTSTILCVFLLGVAVDRLSLAPPSITTTTTSASLRGNDNGWKTLHVFRGNRREPWPPLESDFPSQEGQDKLVAGILMAHNQKKGFYVDLAANHPYTISNTYALERQFGWQGICIEANPQYWEPLIQHRDCHVVAAVVSGERMQEVQFRYGADLGGIISNDLDNKKNGKTTAGDMMKGARETTLYTVTLEEILQRFQAPNTMEYLSLDVEGAEEMVMQNFPFDQYRFKLLTVERPSRTLVDTFRNVGYRFVKKTASFGDLLFAHESALPQLNLTSVGITKRWQLVDRMVDGNPVTENSWEALNRG